MKFNLRYLPVVAAASLANLSYAAGPDFTSLTSSVDFASTTTAVLAVAGLSAAVFMAIKGAKIVLGMIKGR